MTNDLVEWVQTLLAPKPPRIGHELTHDELCHWADAGRDGEG